MNHLQSSVCQRCGYHKLKTWNELTDDEKILVEKLPFSASIDIDERRRHLFCPRCFHESSARDVLV
ncbi:MAG: hypothetical protein H7Z37_06185 [Pyrinomonadaceae bacterium]|nr:hypothetical protein [Pyrinomonadaceae bacterium]